MAFGIDTVVTPTDYVGWLLNRAAPAKSLWTIVWSNCYATEAIERKHLKTASRRLEDANAGRSIARQTITRDRARTDGGKT